MHSIKNWWAGEVDWTTPAGQLLQTFLATLPKDRPFHLTLYGSAPLQLTVDRHLMSGDVDLFSDDDEDLVALIATAKLDKTCGGFYLEPGFELSFRTSLVGDSVRPQCNAAMLLSRFLTHWTS